MIVADIFSGNGVTFIDPHGGLIEDLLQAIPKSRTTDVVYFNPAKREWVIGLNFLESVDSSQRSLVVSSWISIPRNCTPITGAAKGIHLSSWWITTIAGRHSLAPETCGSPAADRSLPTRPER